MTGKTIVVDVNTGERMAYRDAMAVAERYMLPVHKFLSVISPRGIVVATFESIYLACRAQPDSKDAPWWAIGLALDALKAAGKATVEKVPMPSADIHIWDEYRWGAL